MQHEGTGLAVLGIEGSFGRAPCRDIFSGKRELEKGILGDQGKCISRTMITTNVSQNHAYLLSSD